ncbi:hypothetical protein [Amycolatopsis sp. NPDC059021]
MERSGRAWRVVAREGAVANDAFETFNVRNGPFGTCLAGGRS